MLVRSNMQECDYCIQDVVWAAALDHDWPSFSIPQLQLRIAIERNSLLTYKQVRDAIYRLRTRNYPFRHLGFGIYVLESVSIINFAESSE